MTEIYSVAILGLGNIGMLYDYDDESSEVFLSHLKSFYHHPNFRITYLIDKDIEKLEMAKRKYLGGIKYIRSIEEIETMPEVFVLASIPSVNLNMFKRLKDHPEIKLFLIEKPFWSKSLDFSNLTKFSEKCVINYPRKFIPFFQNLKKHVSDNVYGKAISAHIYYSKGLRNNGSHLIDLMNYLFNNTLNTDELHVFNTTFDCLENDPSISFTTKYSHNGISFPVVFQALNEKLFSLIEIDFFFEKRRFRVYDFGEKIEIYQVEQDPIFKNYKNLKSYKTALTNMNKYGMDVCNELLTILKSDKQNISTLVNEYNIFKGIEEIKKRVI